MVIAECRSLISSMLVGACVAGAPGCDELPAGADGVCQAEGRARGTPPYQRDAGRSYSLLPICRFPSKNIFHIHTIYGLFVFVPRASVHTQDLRFLPAASCYTSAISACGACHMKDDALALFHEARRLEVLDKYVMSGVPTISPHVCLDL